MRVFVTGGTGLMGSQVVPQLIAAGHTVTALARSDASADKLTGFGATPVHGDHTSLSVLAKAASEADAVIHLAFNHHLMAVPGGMVQACEEDRAAITALCDALVAAGPSSDGKQKVFINTSGTLGSDGPDETSAKLPNPLSPRGQSEVLTLSYGQKGLRVFNIRLSPVTHDATHEHPFISVQIAAAKKHGAAAYIGTGEQVWPSVHAKDAAALYVLALTKGPGGKNLHAVQEEGIPLKDIAEFIGKKLGLPTKSASLQELMGAGDLGFVGFVMSTGGRATADLTREWTGWQPQEYGLFEEMERHYKF